MKMISTNGQRKIQKFEYHNHKICLLIDILLQCHLNSTGVLKFPKLTTPPTFFKVLKRAFENVKRSTKAKCLK